ncbi:MAG: TonB-dependent hemoglobin/transferrin/lactoferrin family receptor [Burkholderiales bacterium]|nr:MAG: TonB-dependent hemoglobin/transferrin/lactoferrin family receptor [Burkholderiales bacterium]
MTNPLAHRAKPRCTAYLHPLGLAALLACSASAWAQNSTATQTFAETTLKPVIVSGSRSERLLEDVPAPVDLINSEALQRSQITNIRELESQSPNLSVRRLPNRGAINNNNGKEGNAGFNLRGLEGNRVLLLVDGLRAPRNYSFGASSRDNFSLGLIDRIEIVKGPSSALYGSDGIGGLVQFFTKEPERYLKDGKSFGGQASIAYSGEDKGINTGITLAGKASDSLQWLLSASIGRAKELESQGTNTSLNSDRTAPNPQQDRETALLGKIILKPTASQKHTFTLESIDKASEFDLLSLRAKPPFGATSVLSAQADTDNTRRRFTWQGQFKTDLAFAQEIKTALSWQNFKSKEYFANDRNTAADQIRDTRDKESTLQANIQAETLIRGSAVAQKIVYGLDLANVTADHLQTGQTPPMGETFPLKRFPKTKDSTVALFIQDEIIGERWSIIPALRWDSYDIQPEQAGFVAVVGASKGSALSPRLAGTYRITPEWNLYGQWATGFRAPSPDQLNRFFENATAFYRTIANPNLKAEKAKSIEIGIKGSQGGFTLDASVFSAKYSNFIKDNQVVGGTGAAGNPTIFQSINAQSASIHGLEFKGDYKFARAQGAQWSIPFAYGQARGTDDVTGKPLNSVNPAALSLGVKYEGAWGDVALMARNVKAKKLSDIDLASSSPTQYATPSYTTLDLSAQWKITQAWRLNAGISNLTNKKYTRWSDVQGVSSTAVFLDAYTQPGRSINIVLTTDF